jgi:hypothetical protein
MTGETRRMTDERLKKEARLRLGIEPLYDDLTGGFQSSLRLDELVATAPVPGKSVAPSWWAASM